jgi:hypothetical protein
VELSTQSVNCSTIFYSDVLTASLLNEIEYAISTADNKTKSPWIRALRYAWRERREWRCLKAFLQKNGGPAGCAARFAVIKAATEALLGPDARDTGAFCLGRLN